jgi:hypothetical protein
MTSPAWGVDPFMTFPAWGVGTGGAWTAGVVIPIVMDNKIITHPPMAMMAMMLNINQSRVIA